MESGSAKGGCNERVREENGMCNREGGRGGERELLPTVTDGGRRNNHPSLRKMSLLEETPKTLSSFVKETPLLLGEREPVLSLLHLRHGHVGGLGLWG